MSYTTLYGFAANGLPETVREFRNSHGSAMYIWRSLAEGYLSLPSEDGLSGFGLLFARGDLGPVWKLFRDLRVPAEFRAVLGTTFDNVAVKAEDFDRLADALDAFVQAFPPGDGACSLSDQAAALREMQSQGYQAAAWQQTSVSDDLWYEWDHEADESKPYNINSGNKHWYLYDDLGAVARV